MSHTPIIIQSFFFLRNIGALIIRIGFGAQYTIHILRNPQNSTGNYLGSYVWSFGVS